MQQRARRLFVELLAFIFVNKDLNLGSYLTLARTRP